MLLWRLSLYESNISVKMLLVSLLLFGSFVSLFNIVRQELVSNDS